MSNPKELDIAPYGFVLHYSWIVKSGIKLKTRVAISGNPGKLIQIKTSQVRSSHWEGLKYWPLAFLYAAASS